MSEPAPKVNYQELKAWIAALEQYEAATGKPALITVAQSKALIELSKAAHGPNPLSINVGIDDDRDFFGVINHFCNLYKDEGAKVTFEETCVVQPNQLFTSTAAVQLPNSAADPIIFPSAATGGLVNGNDLPSFTRKKDARKYAAKCVVEWLEEYSSQFSHGISPNKNKKRKPNPDAAHLTTMPQTVVATATSQPGPSTTTTTPTINNEESSEEEASSGGSTKVQEMVELCQTLGIHHPKIHLIQIGGELSGIWGGRLEFERKDDVPADLGNVNGVKGRKRCKEAMATLALKYLREVERKREATLKLLEEMED